MLKKDKIQHFGAGVIVAVIALAVCKSIDVDDPKIASIMIVASIALGVGKEAWDYFDPGGVADIWDAVATIAGGVLVTMIYWLV